MSYREYKRRVIDNIRDGNTRDELYWIQKMSYRQYKRWVIGNLIDVVWRR